MPTVSEIAALEDLLVSIWPGTPVSHGALTVIPLIASPRPDPDWLTLVEAGAEVVVEEISEEGSVPALALHNRAERPVLLLDGEELLGAKQNRVLNTTVLVAAQTTVTIPVSCVEQGRWAYRSHRFSSSDHSLYASLRARKAARVSESLRRGDGHAGDQMDVWDGLATKAALFQAASPTAAMSDVYGRHEDELRRAGETLAPRPGQVGALVYLAGRWLGVDLLAAPGLFARVWPRLCSGYAADALGRNPVDGLQPEPDEVLARLKSSAAELAPAIGLGVEHRLQSGAVHGAALVVDERVAHLMAFPAATER